MNKLRGFTVVEMMIGLIILTLLITALFRVFSAGRRNANAVMQNHTINNETELTLMRISDDLRESNAISASYPAILPNIGEKSSYSSQEEYQDAINNELDNNEKFKTDSEDNKLEFTKINYDFTQSTETSLKYTKEIIRYFLEKKEEEDSYRLWREKEYIDENGKSQSDKTEIYPIWSGLKSCQFYQLKDSSNSRTGNIYIRLKLAGDEENKYSNTMTISVKERAANVQNK